MAASAQAPEPRSWIEIARYFASGLDLPSIGLSNKASPVSALLSPDGPQVALVLVAQGYVAWIVSGIGMFARAGVSWAGYGRVLAEQLAAIGLAMGSDSDTRSPAIRTLLDESAARRACPRTDGSRP